MAEKKEKQYVSDNAQLISEWNWEKNNELNYDPKTLTLGSNKKVWWKCNNGHEWQAIIANRHRGSICPYCAGRCVIKGNNDLATINPALAKEWNYEKNGRLTPVDVMSNSGQKLWWKCSIGHEWQARVADRNKGKGCPYCAGQKVLKGYNDLQTINPRLAEEWNYERNGILRPDAFTVNSNIKVWWKCRKGHEWETTISHRNNGRVCPVCDSERHTSFPEYALVYYLKKCGMEVIHSYKEKGYELDVYIPSRKIAIEYDGYRWHKNKVQQDLIKNSKCLKDGISLYRMREGLLSLNDSSLDFVVQRKQENLGAILKEILGEILGFEIDVDLNRDFAFIENLRNHTEKESSILFCNPEIAQEWDYEKNGDMKPDNYTANSSRKVWWKCAKGHRWQAAISSRNKGHGCPYCAGLYVIKGENDLKITNPALAEEWNFEKNGDLRPEDFASNSGKKVWWRCRKGHEWEAAISNRQRGTGCPYCSGNKVLKGSNDLKTVSPVLATEFDVSKNNGSTAAEYFSKSGKTVWWRCSNCGYSWAAQIIKRANGQGCPQCAGEKCGVVK